jgi:hypothetical protein
MGTAVPATVAIAESWTAGTTGVDEVSIGTVSLAVG